MSGPTPIEINGSRTGVLVGFGVQYDLDVGLGLRGEFTSFGRSSPNSDAGAINVGLLWRF